MQNENTDRNLIAACGMNCSLCLGYQRKKNSCAGCYKLDDPNKPKYCRSCIIVNCELLAKTESGFCYECEKYPCTRLKNLDKRYRTKYGMSMLENLSFIQDKGIDAFLENEKERWKCPKCGKNRCVHRDFCLYCESKLT